MALRVLYLAQGDEVSTSQMRGRALARCGHHVDIVDMSACLPRNLWLLRFHWRSGFVLLDGRASRFIAGRFSGDRYDVVWIENGSIVGPRTLSVLRRLSPRLVNYNLDDPTGKRDGNRWLNFRRSVRLYDVLVTVRRETESELRLMGAKNVQRVYRSFDELEHRPLELSAAERERWSSDVLFVGTWMPERSRFFAALLERGVPLTILGDFWQKSPDWKQICRAWKGPAIYGRDYSAAIQCAKVCIGLVSKGNRDLHTQRSTEIPAIGGLLCAERTEEHLQLYRDGEEAVFWSDADECASRCRDLLADREKRESVARSGHAKVLRLNLGNQAVLGGILERIVGMGAGCVSGPAKA